MRMETEKWNGNTEQNVAECKHRVETQNAAFLQNQINPNWPSNTLNTYRMISEWHHPFGINFR